MKDRILKGWTPIRWLYLILGTFSIVNSVMAQEWIGTFIGIYFASMGLFAFGCAAGQCHIPTPSIKDNNSENIQYTEIK